MPKVLLIILAGLTLINCGGGQGSAPQSSPLSASFIDSAVEGLRFSGNELTGTTDVNGTFQFHTGDTVEFFVGDISIGAVLMQRQSVITPIDLVAGAVDENNPTVINIVRFLLSLDEDQDPDNGIKITDAISAAAQGQALDFAATDFDTQAASAVNMLSTSAFGSARPLVTINAALSHFRETLGVVGPVGTYNGSFIGDMGGVWTFTVNTDDSITGCSLPDGVPIESADVLLGTINDLAVSIDVGTINSGFTFNGSIADTGDVSGTWSTAMGSGTYTGTRSIAPALECPSDNPPPNGGVDPMPIDEDIAEIGFRAIKPIISISRQPDVLREGNIGTPIDPPQDPAFSRERQTSCGSNPAGTRSILHNGINNPSSYSVIYENCDASFVNQQARMSGRVDARNFSGSGADTRVDLSFSNFVYHWNAGEVEISGSIVVDSIGSTSISNLGGLTIKYTDPIGFNGPTVTTYTISSLNIDVATSAVSSIDSTYDVQILMQTSADDDELKVETPIPLDFPAFSQIPRSGSLLISENVIGGAIVKIEDRFTGDGSSDFNFIDITTDFNGNGLIDGLDDISENQWQFLDY